LATLYNRLLHNGYRVFPVRPGGSADHSPPSSAAVMEEYSYTSTHPLGHTWPVTGTLYLSLLNIITSGKNRLTEIRPPTLK